VLKVNASLSQISWKAVPQLWTCSCETPTGIHSCGRFGICQKFHNVIIMHKRT